MHRNMKEVRADVVEIRDMTATNRIVTRAETRRPRASERTGGSEDSRRKAKKSTASNRLNVRHFFLQSPDIL